MFKINFGGHRARLSAAVISAALAIAAPLAARAADGTTDLFINPATGVTISTPGSYRLVSNVTMTANVTPVVITAANVTLDLGGHAITAFSTTTTNGISGLQAEIVVSNGAVKGFWATGILLGVRAAVRDCVAQGNNRGGNGSGINVGDDSIVERCIVNANNPVGAAGYTGIFATNNCRIIGNVVTGHANGGATNNTCLGIRGGAGCEIASNTVSGNSGNTTGNNVAGIFIVPPSTVRDNVIRNTSNTGSGPSDGIITVAGGSCLIVGNVCTGQSTATTGAGTATGIKATTTSMILDNECVGNSAGAGSNGNGIGISAGSGSLVRGNRCEVNNGAGTGFGAGISAASNGRIEANHCRGNVGGATGWGIRVTGVGNFVADNTAQGNSTSGASFAAATNNRTERNRFRQTTGIDLVTGVAPASAGAGDLADVVF